MKKNLTLLALLFVFVLSACQAPAAIAEIEAPASTLPAAPTLSLIHISEPTRPY